MGQLWPAGQRSAHMEMTPPPGPGKQSRLRLALAMLACLSICVTFGALLQSAFNG